MKYISSSLSFVLPTQNQVLSRLSNWSNMSELPNILRYSRAGACAGFLKGVGSEVAASEASCGKSPGAQLNQ